MELVDLLLSSKDNFLAANQIAISVEKAKRKLVDRLLNNIKDKLDHSHIKYIEDTTSSINILYISKKEYDVSYNIYVRLEVDDYLSIGYCCSSNGLDNKETISPKEIVKFIDSKNHCKIDHSSWWIYKEYIYDEDDNDCFLFKPFNANSYKLLDQEYLEILSQKVVKKIFGLLKK